MCVYISGGPDVLSKCIYMYLYIYIYIYIYNYCSSYGESVAAAAAAERSGALGEAKPTQDIGSL